jgi:hypothetical protein
MATTTDATDNDDAPTRRVPTPTPVSSGRKPRPDPGPLRIVMGLTGIATASALVAAFLAPAPGTAIDAAATQDATAPVSPSGPVRRVVRYVQLQPGETPPPDAVVQQAPAPSPRVVIVQTKQSGSS